MHHIAHLVARFRRGVARFRGYIRLLGGKVALLRLEVGGWGTGGGRVAVASPNWRQFRWLNKKLRQREQQNGKLEHGLNHQWIYWTSQICFQLSSKKETCAVFGFSKDLKNDSIRSSIASIRIKYSRNAS